MWGVPCKSMWPSKYWSALQSTMLSYLLAIPPPRPLLAIPSPPVGGALASAVARWSNGERGGKEIWLFSLPVVFPHPSVTVHWPLLRVNWIVFSLVSYWYICMVHMSIKETFSMICLCRYARSHSILNFQLFNNICFNCPQASFPSFLSHKACFPLLRIPFAIFPSFQDFQRHLFWRVPSSLHSLKRTPSLVFRPFCAFSDRISPVMENKRVSIM